MTPIMPIIIINVIAALALTTLTGAIFTVAWELIGFILEKIGFFHIRYNLLKLVTFFYLVPISYIVIELYGMKYRYSYLFSPTPQICAVCIIGLLFWITGATIVFVRLLIDIRSQKKRFKHTIPCDVNVEDLFQDAKRQLGINSKQIQLRQSYCTEIACVIGILRPRVILPVHNYSKDVLTIILLHELEHYKQKDIVLKVITYVILAFHFYNPFAWYLFHQVQKLSEIACDYKICNRIGDMNFYYKTLALIAYDRNNGKVFRLSSQLVERKHDLVERTIRMKSLFGKKQKSKWSMMVALFVTFLASSTSVYAASVKSVENYNEWYSATEVENAEAVSVTEIEEFTEFGDKEGIKTIIMDNGISTYGLSNIDWEIPNNIKAATGYFKCAVDDTVNVWVVVEPKDVTVKVGIEYSDGTKRYVNCTGSVSHDFIIYKAGYYRVYVENESGETINALGSYITP